MRASWTLRERPRSSARSCSGATTIRLFQFVDGLGAADQNSLPAGENHPQRLPQTASAGCTLLVACQRLAGRADGVDPIVLGATGTLERPNLDDRLTGGEEEHDQAGGEATGSFQCPDPPAWRVLSRPGEHPVIASAVSSIGQLRADPTGAGFEHGQVDCVAIWVASDDVVVLLCDHDHCGCPSIRG
jgi:hypothetical protein